MTDAQHRCRAEVSLRQITENYQAVRDVVGPTVEIAAVVKSEAYGHGALEVSRALLAAGARRLAVSTAEEGVALRNAAIRVPILIMADSPRYAHSAFLDYDLTPVLHSLDDLALYNDRASARARRVPIHLKLDTGMGRLGTLASAVDIASALRASTHLELEGLMSHFATADDYTTTQADEQARVFEETCAALSRLGIVPTFRHTASTNAIAYGRREAWHNVVRPGLALYGYLSPSRGPAPQALLKVKPALTWKAGVLAVKDVPAGAKIGYGGTFQAQQAMRIAVLGVGYADGYWRSLSNRGTVIAASKPAPVIGIVSMDLTTIDVTACPSLRAGHSVTLLGAEGGVSIQADEIARLTGTISYDVLSGIRSRVPRVYV